MDTLKQLQDRRGALVKEHGEKETAIVKQMTTMSGAAKDGILTADDQVKYDALDAQVSAGQEAHAGELEPLDAAITRNTKLRELERRQIPQTTTQGTSHSQSFTAPGETHTGAIQITKEAHEDDPNRGFATPRELLTCIMETSQSGMFTDDRLKPLCAAGSDEQSTFADPYGGFLIPEGFTPNLLSTANEADPLAGRTTMVPMALPSISFPARVDKDHSTSVSGGLTVSRRAEGDTVSPTRMEFEKVKLEAHMLFGLAYATEELLERSPISFITLLEAGFRDEFSAKILDERLNGTGVGEYEGIMTSPALITIAKESGQVADTIVFKNITKMRARCWRYGNAIWLANHDTLPTLVELNQPVGTGGVTVWHPSGREDHPDILFGRPIFFTEFTQTVGDLGDIILVNGAEYLEGTLSGLRSAESIHVRFINHERTFKFWMENDGRSWWRSALTPKRGATLSPFVALAARA